MEATFQNLSFAALGLQLEMAYENFYFAGC